MPYHTVVQSQPASFLGVVWVLWFALTRIKSKSPLHSWWDFSTNFSGSFHHTQAGSHVVSCRAVLYFFFWALTLRCVGLEDTRARQARASYRPCGLNTNHGVLVLGGLDGRHLLCVDAVRYAGVLYSSLKQNKFVRYGSVVVHASIVLVTYSPLVVLEVAAAVSLVEGTDSFIHSINSIRMLISWWNILFPGTYRTIHVVSCYVTSSRDLLFIRRNAMHTLTISLARRVNAIY